MHDAGKRLSAMLKYSHLSAARTLEELRLLPAWKQAQRGKTVQLAESQHYWIPALTVCCCFCCLLATGECLGTAARAGRHAGRMLRGVRAAGPRGLRPPGQWWRQ